MPVSQSQCQGADPCSGELPDDERPRYFGKYRGTVVAIEPTMFMLTARVPAVLGGMITGWARPCMPFAGMGAGMFGMPLPNSNVWIEFLDGDPDYPVWTGCFFENPAEAPMAAKLLPNGMGIGTFSGDVVGVSDAMGVLLQSGINTVMLNDAGLTITIGSATISVTSAAITIGLAGGAQLVLSAAGAVVSAGGAGSVMVTTASTMINGTALVVT